VSHTHTYTHTHTHTHVCMCVTHTHTQTHTSSPGRSRDSPPFPPGKVRSLGSSVVRDSGVEPGVDGGGGRVHGASERERGRVCERVCVRERGGGTRRLEVDGVERPGGWRLSYMYQETVLYVP